MYQPPLLGDAAFPTSNLERSELLYCIIKTIWMEKYSNNIQKYDSISSDKSMTKNNSHRATLMLSNGGYNPLLRGELESTSEKKKKWCCTTTDGCRFNDPLRSSKYGAESIAIPRPPHAHTLGTIEKETTTLFAWQSDRCILKTVTPWTDHDPYHPQILTCRSEVLHRICREQIQPRKHVLDHVDHTDQGCICPERSRSSGGNRSYRSSVRGVF